MSDYGRALDKPVRQYAKVLLERCESGRIGLTANELTWETGSEGSNPSLSAQRSTLLQPPAAATGLAIWIDRQDSGSHRLSAPVPFTLLDLLPSARLPGKGRAPGPSDRVDPPSRAAMASHLTSAYFDPSHNAPVSQETVIRQGSRHRSYG